MKTVDTIIIALLLISIAISLYRQFGKESYATLGLATPPPR